MGCLLISLGFKVSDNQPPLLFVLAWLVANALDNTFEFGGTPIENGEIPWRNKAPFERSSNEFKDDEVRIPPLKKTRILTLVAKDQGNLFNQV
jgi:hypothetical protein